MSHQTYGQFVIDLDRLDRLISIKLFIFVWNGPINILLLEKKTLLFLPSDFEGQKLLR